MASLTPQQREALDAFCGEDGTARRLVLAHLATLRDFRASEVFYAFLAPRETRRVHSVIDRTYGTGPQEYAQHVERLQHLQEQWQRLDTLLHATEEGA